MVTKKKRVYELAKDYGMSGQELAAKLKELGINEVKGHMTALDEFQLLRVQGVLEAYGIRAADSGEEDVVRADGLTVKKRKKKIKLEPGAGEAPVEFELAPEPAPPSRPLPRSRPPCPSPRCRTSRPTYQAAATAPPCRDPRTRKRPSSPSRRPR